MKRKIYYCLVLAAVALLAVSCQKEESELSEFSYDMVWVDGGDSLPSYYIGRTEVTEALWALIMADSATIFDIDFTLSQKPVRVPFDKIGGFVARLNQLTGKKYQLASDAQWMFAAQGGVKSHGYRYSGSDDAQSVAWFKGNSDGVYHDVAQKDTNELGIYDMSGNAEEWTTRTRTSYGYKGGAKPPYSVFAAVRGGNITNGDFPLDSIHWVPVDASSAGHSVYPAGFRLVLSE